MGTVLFVCAHGAYRSRLAAAFFNAARPAGWRATSAGVEPQETMSQSAAGLLRGTPAEPHLDLVAPRTIAAAGRADRTISIDCDVPGAERWSLASQEVGPEQRDEIRAQVERLATELSAG